MSKLIVSLPYTSLGSTANTASTAVASNTLYAFVLSKDGLNDDPSKVKAGMLGLSELPQADETVLVVPTRAISWHQIDLPKVAKTKLRAVLDGLLEERLLDDTHEVAFALSPDAQGGKANKAEKGVWVAVCDKAWLNHAIQTFDAAGYRITQVVPELWPQNVTTISITGTPEEAWISRADSEGVMTLPLHLGDTSGTLQALLAQLPTGTTIGAEPAVVELAEASLLPYTDLKVQLRPQTVSLLYSATSLWELAQFEQSLSGDSQGMKSLIRQWQAFWQSPAWRPARWGLVALLCANLVGLNVWAWQQQASLTKKRAQLGSILTQTFPNVKTVVDPGLQMSREMVSLRQATGASSVHNFESILSALASLNTSSSVVFNTPTAIEYAANSSGTSVNFKNVKLATTELIAAQEKFKTLGYALSQNGDSIALKVQAAP
jgi:general secretion pathway protein L